MRRHPRDREAAIARAEIELEVYRFARSLEGLTPRQTIRALMGSLAPGEDHANVQALREKVSKACEARGLTEGERAMLIGGMIQSEAKYMIRYERHGNYETPGGLEE